MTKSIQSAVMHAVMKHSGKMLKKHKGKEPKEEKVEAKEVPDDEEGEYEDEPGEQAYAKYKEPKLKGKKKEKK